MMQNFHIKEDAENNDARRRKKSKKLLKELTHGAVPRGALQVVAVSNTAALEDLNNGSKRDVKRIKLISEDEPCLKVTLEKIYQKALKTKKSEEELNERLLYVAEYRQDVWKYLLELERNQNYPKPQYMLKQTEICWRTRAILVDWFASVTEEYSLSNETFQLSVNYVDRVLSKLNVVRTKFQLVGVAAMSLAGKMEEISPIDVQEWTYLAGDAFTSNQILKMERLVARVLKCNMRPPTITSFIEHFCVEHSLNSKTTHLALYLSDLVLLEGEEYLNVLPSKLAASCIALARYTLAETRPWPKKFQEQFGYTVQQLSPVLKKQQKTFRDRPAKEQKAIQTKYVGEKYDKVALLKPRSCLNFEEFAGEE
ncbi:G2/mitotic-specific cyclin-A-like [Anthonomus grandis grandis]|uniref:G2/mitotic-specific cyclin-A-like n=1 Tax=Anthonomus grandis grandis TaxID=2921223 RepID=UPI002164F6F4|nr:G2/mitotic-specific cyclin-A-like [Anthonomus grandis grandis]